jgi:DNA-binding NtrC family response regulator
MERGGPPSVLVVDDDEGFHDDIARHLQPYRVHSAYNGWQMFDVLAEQHVDVLLLDIKLPGRSGLDLLPDLCTSRPELPVIIITAFASIETAVAAIKGGAFDFVEKRLEEYRRLGQRIDTALAHRAWVREGRSGPTCLVELARFVAEVATLDLPPASGLVFERCAEDLTCAVDRLVTRDRRADRPTHMPFKVLCNHFGRLLILATIQRCGGNKRHAAKLLGIHYQTILNWLARQD